MPYRTRTKFRVLGWQLFTLFSCIGLAAYFGCHTVSGRYGLSARSTLLTRTTALEFEAESLAKVRKQLENDIALLAPDPPDPEIVGEMARDLLGYADPRDHIIKVR